MLLGDFVHDFDIELHTKCKDKVVYKTIDKNGIFKYP